MPDETREPAAVRSILLTPGGAPRPPVLVRILAAVMVVWEPLLLGLAVSAALARLPLYGAPAYLLVAARGAVAAFGIVVGRRLWAGDDDARRLALGWVVAACALALLTIVTPYFPGNRTPGDKQLALVATTAWYALWALYLLRQASRRGAPRRDSRP